MKLNFCDETELPGVEGSEVSLFAIEVPDERDCITLTLFAGLGGFLMGKKGFEKSGILRALNVPVVERILPTLLAGLGVFLEGIGISGKLRPLDGDAIEMYLAGLFGFIVGEKGFEKSGGCSALNVRADALERLLFTLLTELGVTGDFEKSGIFRALKFVTALESLVLLKFRDDLRGVVGGFRDTRVLGWTFLLLDSSFRSKASRDLDFCIKHAT